MAHWKPLFTWSLIFQVLHTLGRIHEQVRAHAVGTKRPNLAALVDVHVEVVGHCTGALFGFVARAKVGLLFFDGDVEAVRERRSFAVQPVVLVR